SRTAWLGLLVSFCVVGSISWQARKLARYLLAVTLTGIVVWFCLFVCIPGLINSQSTVSIRILGEVNSIEARFSLWAEAVQLIRAAPLLGVGPMHFSAVNNGLGAHPHNFILQVACEWGVVAALALIFFICILVWRLFIEVRFNKESDGVALSVFVAVLTWCVGIQLDGYMVVPSTQVLSAVVLALGVSRAAQKSQLIAKARNEINISRYVVALFVFFAAIAQTFVLFFTPFGQAEDREIKWRITHSEEHLWPRYWQLGWIGPEDDPTFCFDAKKSPHCPPTK
ncbi:MAG TPA: O-antigen ligase family protein, partial [Burkholderiaceae bacterium]|nr:O-antigen ligase family protein [Burkholderiaceae bacterium]